MAKGIIEGRVLAVKTKVYDGKEKNHIELYSGDDVCKISCGAKEYSEFSKQINDEVLIPVIFNLWSMNGKSGIGYRIIPAVD